MALKTVSILENSFHISKELNTATMDGLSFLLLNETGKRIRSKWDNQCTLAIFKTHFSFWLCVKTSELIAASEGNKLGNTIE